MYLYIRSTDKASLSSKKIEDLRSFIGIFVSKNVFNDETGLSKYFEHFEFANDIIKLNNY